MRAELVNLGFSVADGEDVEVRYQTGELVLSFTDWKENRIERRFEDVLAFRWASRPSVATARDDSVFRVDQSQWLLQEVRDESVNADDYEHYVLCFNAVKTLEILALKQSLPGQRSRAE